MYRTIENIAVMNVEYTCLRFDKWHFFYQVGIMGLVEEEWIETLATLDPEDVTYLDFVSKGNELCQSLKEKVNGHTFLYDIYFFDL